MKVLGAMKPNLKDFPKLEDWAYKDLLVFYNQAISWKISFEAELREDDFYKFPDIDVNAYKLIKEVLGE